MAKPPGRRPGPRRPRVDNNSRGLAGKVGLRVSLCESLNSRNSLDSRKLRVLDAYAGSGRLWRAVKREVPGDLVVTSVDTRRFRGVINKDNRQVLAGVDLSVFDVIDLDSYGVPADQVELVAEAGWRGPLVWTCICTLLGTMPHKVLVAEGIPVEWCREAPVVTGGRDVEDLRQRWCNYLAGFGWLHHAVLSDSRPGSAALYGLSTFGLLPVTRSGVGSAILAYRERHSHPLGEQHMEPEDGLHPDHGRL
jgi:hypothetical protein